MMKEQDLMRVSKVKIRLFFVFLFMLIMGVSGAPATIDEILSKEPTYPIFGANERVLAQNVRELLRHAHYSPKAMTPAFAEEWYNNYFKELDPGKIFFLQSDLDEFRSYQRALMNSRDTSTLDFVSKVFHRYLERVRAYARFCIECVDTPMDYTVQEFVEFDRKKAAWAKTQDELEKLWYLRVKNSLLMNKLDEEEIAEKKTKATEKKQKNDNVSDADENAGKIQTAAEDKKEASEEKTEDAETKAKTPTKIERLKRSFATVYERKLELTSLEIMESFLNSLTEMYDPHTLYMAPDVRDDFDIHMNLKLEGIGATLSMRDSYCTIVSLVPGGPADKEGTLKEGDRIIEVCQDGAVPVDVVDMPLNKIVKQIRGKKGTLVHLTILGKNSNKPIHVTIRRDEIKLEDEAASFEIKEVKLSSGKTGRVLVIYLPSFYINFQEREHSKEYVCASADVKKILKDAQATKPLDGVILDLRGNGGGSLDDCITLAGLFDEGGPVVQTRSPQRGIDALSDPANGEKRVYEGPLFVLVDRSSASASEIVAGYLQDTGRALILGTESTHGKGTVQTLYDLNKLFKFNWLRKKTDFGTAKITIAKFYRVNGDSTQERGVISDVSFPSYQDYLETSERYYPYVLPYDRIPPTEFVTWGDFTSENIKQLQAESKRHREANPDYQEYVKEVSDFGRLQSVKSYPLEIQARRAYEKESDALFKKISKLVMGRKKNREKTLKSNRKNAGDSDRESEDEDESDAEEGKDVILDEAVYLMKYYIEHYN